MNFEVTDTDALVLIDIQHDFMSGGSLEVPNADEILPEVAKLAEKFSNIIITQDFHPAGHKSFASSYDDKQPFDTVEMPYGTQVLWPDHCVQGTKGAELNLPEWILNKAQMIIRKGFRPEVDSYSMMLENDQKTQTGLAGYLKDRGIKRLFLCGLATDYCVAFSAIDANEAGFEVVLMNAACRGITEDGTQHQISAMKYKGIHILY